MNKKDETETEPKPKSEPQSKPNPKTEQQLNTTVARQRRNLNPLQTQSFNSDSSVASPTHLGDANGDARDISEDFQVLVQQSQFSQQSGTGSGTGTGTGTRTEIQTGSVTGTGEIHAVTSQRDYAVNSEDFFKVPTHSFSVSSFQPIKSAQVLIEQKKRRFANPLFSFSISFQFFHEERIKTSVKVVSTLLGIILGFVLKIYLPKDYWTERRISYLEFPGELFNNMLACIRLPLIMTAVIAAVGSMDTTLCRSLGLRGLVYIFISTVVASIVGICSAFLLSPAYTHQSVFNCNDPGSKSSLYCQRLKEFTNYGANDARCTLWVDILLDFVGNAFPPNIVQAIVYEIKTFLDLKLPLDAASRSYATCGLYVVNNTYGTTVNLAQLGGYQMSRVLNEEPNVNGVVLFSIVVGVSTYLVGTAGRPFLNIFVCLSQATLRMAQWILWTGPVGVMCLIAGDILRNENLFTGNGNLGWYLAIILLAFVLYTFVILPLVYWIFIRENPFWFLWSIVPIIVAAFRTASSSATIPMTINILENTARINVHVTRFLIPIGASMNFIGTAIFISATVVFLALSQSIPLSGSDIFHIVLIAVIMTFLNPSGNTVYGTYDTLEITIALNVLGINSNIALLIVPAIWSIGRVLTVSNIVNNCVGVVIVNHNAFHKLFRKRDYYSELLLPGCIKSKTK